jgi:hypothetical protein
MCFSQQQMLRLCCAQHIKQRLRMLQRKAVHSINNDPIRSDPRLAKVPDAKQHGMSDMPK